MRKKLKPGILFRVQGPTPTSIVPSDIIAKESEVKAEMIDASTIRLSFSVLITNAELSETGFEKEEEELKKLGHFKFMDISKKKLKLKENLTTTLEQAQGESLVNFTFLFPLDDGKIGGAG